MKQGNINSRVDLGWERMQPILNEELPLKKARRKLLWLWLLPCIAIVGLASYFVLSATETTIIKKQDEKNATASDIVNVETKKNSLSSNPIVQENKESKTKNWANVTATVNATKTNEDSSLTPPAINKVINSTESVLALETVKSISPNEGKHQHSSKSVLAAAVPTLSTTANVTATRLFQPQATKEMSAAATTSRFIKTNETSTLLAEIRPLSITLSNAHKRPIANSLEIAFSDEHQEAITPQASKNLTGFAAVNLAGFYSSSYPSYGTELNLSYGIQLGKLNLGITAGPGYYFSDLFTTPILIENNDPSGGAPAFDNNATNNPESAMGGFPDIDTLMNKVAIAGYRWYLNAGINLGYQFGNRFNVQYQLGIEKYTSNNMASLAQEDERDISEQNQIAAISDSNNWVPYHQAHLSYLLSNKVSLGLAYRLGTKNVLKTDTKSYDTDKLFLDLTFKF